MIKEFKEFISQGNVLDMAIGVIIGGAFSAIINALVENLLMPVVSMVIGAEGFTSLSVTVNGTIFEYGKLIQAIVNFLIIAAVLFMILKAANSVKKKPEVVEETPVVPEDIQLLREIRDSLNK